MKLDEDKTTICWIAKGLAVIAIVACHCCHVSENASALNQISYKFMNLWMGLGVPVFYFFAGYFMNTRIGWRAFWKKKSITIILPWIFTGSMVWLYVVLRKGGASFSGWADFVLFKQSYLYFLTDLIIFYVFTWLIRSKKATSLVLAFVVLILFLNDIFHFKTLDMILGYIYLNNYVYFLFGKCLSYSKCQWHNKPTETVGCIAAWFVLHFLELGEMQYIIRLVNGCLGIMGMIYISVWIKDTMLGRVVETFGKRSFCIYLLHMPIAGIIANLFNRTEKLSFLTIFRPLIVIGITLWLIRIYLGIVKCDFGRKLIGYRE